MAIDKICPKCGHEDVTMQFYKVGDIVKDEDVMTCKEHLKNIKDINFKSFARGEVEQECVRIHCRTCQFAWCELPEDFPKPVVYQKDHPFMKDNTGNFPYWLLLGYSTCDHQTNLFDGWKK